MKIRFYNIIFIVTLIVIVTVLFGCSRFKHKQHIIVATSPNMPPLEMISKDNKIIGFDIDLIKAIASQENFSIEIIPVIKNNLFYGLIDGTYNMVISGIRLTSALKSKQSIIDFSLPYLTVGDVLVISEDFHTYHSLKDLQGKKVAIRNGSPVKNTLKELKGISIVEYKDITKAFNDLARATIAAIAVDLPTASQFVYYSDEYKGIFTIVPHPLTTTQYVLAVKKNDTELLKTINNGIISLKKQETLKKLIMQWFYPQ